MLNDEQRSPGAAALACEASVSNGVPTDLVALLVGVVCGLVLGRVYGRDAPDRTPRALRRRRRPRRDDPLSRRLRGGSEAEWN